MASMRLDYTSFFRLLSTTKISDFDTLINPSNTLTYKLWKQWINKYQLQLLSEYGESLIDKLRMKKMKDINPNFAPYNGILQETLNLTKSGDQNAVMKMQMLLSNRTFVFSDMYTDDIWAKHQSSSVVIV